MYYKGKLWATGQLPSNYDSRLQVKQYLGQTITVKDIECFIYTSTGHGLMVQIDDIKTWL